MRKSGSFTTKLLNVKIFDMMIIRLLFLLALVLPSIAYAAPDFAKPTLSSTRDLFPGEIRENVNACVMLDPTSGANIPEGAIWYDYANGVFKRYESSVWVTKNLIIPDGAVSTAAKLADSVVTSAKILDSTIATADIGDGEITAAKLASDASRTTLLLSNTGTVSNGTTSGSFGPIVRLPKGFTVTHLTASLAQATTAGTVTVKVSTNQWTSENTAAGGVTSSALAVFSTGHQNAASYMTLGSPINLSANQTLIPIWETSGVTYAVGTTSEITLQLWGHFTE